MANRSIDAFFELLRAGLWGTNAQLSQFQEVDFKEIYKTAEDQSVLGLVAAGIENALDSKIPQEDALSFVGRTLQIEQRNQAMNQFLVLLYKELENKGISSVLVKGQGVAQCYERPLWRVCGDVDLLFDDDNYNKAKQLLIPLASSIEEDVPRKHLGMTFGLWSLELHGTLRATRLPPKMDELVDSVQNNTFENKQIRIWQNEDTKVLLPAPNNDVIILFVHILQHFFVEGIGLRQLCDWCRLLWTYRSEIDHGLLLNRLKKGGMLSEWSVFAYLTVNYLGMPKEAMPLYSGAYRWEWKAKRVLSLILETGTFGHKRRKDYKKWMPYAFQKVISFFLLTRDSFKRLTVFPLDTIYEWTEMVKDGVSSMRNRL